MNEIMSFSSGFQKLLPKTEAEKSAMINPQESNVDQVNGLYYSCCLKGIFKNFLRLLVFRFVFQFQLL